MVAGRHRIRWKKLLSVVLCTYFGFWMAVSLGHLWTLNQTIQGLDQKIAVVQQKDQVLRNEIGTLHNPSKLKKIITGQAPMPSPDVTVP